MTFWMFASALVQALAWPLTVMAIMSWFRYPLTDLLLRMGRARDEGPR